MNKCFITKLPSSVDNDNLPVLGQLKISWLKQNNLTNNDARAIGLATNDSIVVKVSGAHLTDNTLTSNLGNTKTITAANGFVWLYVSNDTDATLTIDNKYALTQINAPKQADGENSIYFDIKDIKYCTNLTALILSHTQVSGDISAVSKLTNLTHLDLSSKQVSGDISAVSKLTNLTHLDLSSTQVSGDISAVSKLTNLTVLNLPSKQVSGDISAVSKLTNLTHLILSSTQVSGDISAVSKLTNLIAINLSHTQVSGDISAVSKLTNLTALNLSHTQVSGDIDNLAALSKLIDNINLKDLALTGDMSKIPAGVYIISQNGRKVTTNFTWTANGRQNATLLAMEGAIPFDTASMDNMLIDQATCTFKGKDSQPLTKIISVKGTRTSASDAAVTAIQSKGITITGVTKQA